MAELKMRTCILFFMAWTLQTVGCYPNGAVTESCDSMIPNHGANGQSSQTPYSVTTDRSTVVGGDVLSVTLQGTSSFTGFLLEARADGGSAAVGTFSVTSSTARLLKCSGISNSAVSQTSGSRKNSVNVQWTAPQTGSYKNIVFSATFVQSVSVFWVQVKSLPVTYSSAQLITSTIATTSTTSTLSTAGISPMSFISSAGCGTSKLCLSRPAGCDPASSSSCYFLSLKYSSTNSSIQIEIFGQSNGYVSFGFSDDQQMGNDDIYICGINSAGIAQVQRAYSTGRTAPQITALGNVSNINTYVNNENIGCTFTSYNPVSTQRSAASTSTYYLLFAYGPTTNAVIQFHTTTFESSQMADITSAHLVEAKAEDVNLVKMHGSLMLISWMTTGTLGMIIARYFKNTAKGHHCCDKDLWFVAHVSLMSLTVIATSIAFIVIFIYAMDWSGGAHPVLGCLVMILALIQPLAAAFRCDPGHKLRFIFNWAHILNALVMKILAVAAIFTGLAIVNTSGNQWLQKIMGGFFAWEILFFVLHELYRRRTGEEGNQSESCLRNVEVILLFIFFLGNITFLAVVLWGISNL